MNEQLNDPFEQVAPPSLPQLNPGQQIVHDRCVEYIKGVGSLPKIVMIRGFAGTGKTFVTNRIINTVFEQLKTEKIRGKNHLAIAASAPTHKAVRVLRKAADLGTKVQYSTIHSLLGLRPEPEEENGRQVFKKSTNPEDGHIDEVDFLLLDEISQLGKALWSELMNAMDEYGFGLILLGDAAQIPPVKEEDSLPFLQAEEYGIEVLTLDQSMRQSGDSPILDYATRIRETYKTTTFVNPGDYAKTDDHGNGLAIISGTDSSRVREILEDYFGSDKFKADADYMKVVTWTNAVADDFNKKIRRMLYPLPEGMMSLPMIVNGEKLIMDERYVAAGEFKPIILPTNEEVEVEKYEVVRKAVSYWTYNPMGKMQGTLNPQVYRALVRFRNANNNWVRATLDIVHETSTAEVKSVLDKISDSAKKAPFGMERKSVWKHFWEVHGLFAKIKYNYAVTAHKAQGSTYDNCMAIMYNIKANPKFEERNRIMYVAATRARHKLYIIE